VLQKLRFESYIPVRVVHTGRELDLIAVGLIELHVS
jgi:hypothetical protein